MTPSPERLGPGIINVDAEKKLPGVKEEINNIIKNAIKNVKTDRKVDIIGLIFEREMVSGKTIDYVHPAITIFDPTYSAYDDDAYDELVLGGNNFANLFPFNYMFKSVNWGGEVGISDYNIINIDDPAPLSEFLDSTEARFYFDIVNLYELYTRAELDNEVNLIEKWEIADFLLPKTIDAKAKLETAQVILTGLKNAGGLKQA